MSAYTNPVDYLCEAHARLRYLLEMLVHTDREKGFELGPDAAQGLYLVLENVQENIAEARALLEPV